MGLHLIIDGYNLIRQSAELSRIDRQDITAGRDALLGHLAGYRRLKTPPHDGRVRRGPRSRGHP